MNTMLQKLKKRFQTLRMLGIICLLMCVANNINAAVGDTFTQGNLKYTVLTESGTTGTVKVQAVSTSISGTLSIPEEVTNSSITYKVTSIGNDAFYGCKGLTGDLVIPNSVTSIGSSAFYGCSGFNGSVKIPNSVTSIGNFAFYGCSGLTGDLVIPNSVTSIGSSAFYGCSGLTGDLVIPNSVSSIGSSAFNGCSGLTGDLVIPNSVSSIGSGAFYGCSGLTGDLVIPNSVTSIGDYAFNGCSGLTGDLVIPNSVTSIGNFAFYGCKKVKHITLPTTLPLISKNLISNSSVEDLTIPQINNVSSINCQDINNIFYLSSTFPTYSNSSPSFGHSKMQKLYVKSTTYKQLKNSTDGSNWISHYTITDKVPVTFPSDRSYITLCRDFDVDFRQTNDNLPAGISPLKAYIVSEIDEKSNAVVLQEITYVPSRLRSNEDGFTGYDEYVGVLLKGTPGYTYYYKIGEDDYTKGKDEQMTVEKALALTGGTVPTGKATFVGCNDPRHVVPEETEDGVTYKTYGLKNNQFLAYSKEGYVPYNHAYLRIPTSSSVGAKGLVNLVFKNADGTTSIQSIDIKKPSYEKDVMYNLQGMRVDDSYHGIVIVNGKKILKK